MIAHHVYPPVRARLRIALKAHLLPLLACLLFVLAIFGALVALADVASLVVGALLALGTAPLFALAVRQDYQRARITVLESWALGISPTQAEIVIRELVKVRTARAWGALVGYEIRLTDERGMVLAGGETLSAGWHDGQKKIIAVWNEASRHDPAGVLWWELGHAVDQRLGPAQINQPGPREDREMERLAWRQEHGLDWESHRERVVKLLEDA